MYAIIALSLFSHAENINECKTDIYYGNGVWNSSEDAKKSRRALEKRIVNKEIIKNDPLLKAKYGKVKLAYNWGQGRLFDVLETYYQLREAGQLDGVGFYAAIAVLTMYRPDITISAYATQKLMEPFTKDWEQGNVDEMWQAYYRESFKLGHRVLLVSHSQGNLFANRIFDTIDPTEYKKYFANIQVASPASKVKADEVGKGAHVTLWGDPIINPIPGSMSPNAQGSPGHAFVEAYLDQRDPYDKIVSRIKTTLPTLDAELTQWTTDQEFSKDTCDYRITVKHRFDPSIEMAEKVYPFNAAKKLYQAKNKAGAYEYVKATCGGTHILDEWSGKKDDECWMIDNPPKEKIMIDLIKEKIVFDSNCFIYVMNYYVENPYGNAQYVMECGTAPYVEELAFIPQRGRFNGPIRIEYKTWDEYRKAGYDFVMNILDVQVKIAKNYLDSVSKFALKKYPNAHIRYDPIIMQAYDYMKLYKPCSVYATDKGTQGCSAIMGLKVYN